jgi:uncharacterized protein with FMN-binding domain
MKRFLAALSLTIAGLAFVAGFRTRDTIPAEAADGTQPTGGSSTADATTNTEAGGGGTTTTHATSSTDPTTTTIATVPTTGTLQVEGPTVQTHYGPVQVAVVVQDGTLVDVVALQLPGGNSESNAINAYAEPLLQEMALEVQSADIDVVSGATFTSLAYAESLQAALDQAGM